MGELLILIVIVTSSVFAYSWSYRVLWFKTNLLYQSLSPTVNNDKFSELDTWSTDSNGFVHKFYTEYSVSSHTLHEMIRILFAASMVCYLVLIEVVLWQITASAPDGKEGFVTSFIWPLLLFCLTILLTTVQPFLMLISILDKFFNDKLGIEKLAMITAGTVFVLNLTLYYIEFGPFIFTNSLLTKLSVAGVSMLSILSAIATVSTIYYTFLMVWKRGNLSGIQNINTIGDRLSLWASDYSVRERINDYKRNIDGNIEILKRLESETGGSQSILRDKLIEKIGWYQLEVNKLETQQNESQFIRNSKKVFHIMFLIYCIHKVVTTFVSRIPYLIIHALYYPDDYNYEYFDQDKRSNFGSDPLSVTMASLLNFFLFRFNYAQDIDDLARQISLLMSISLFGASFSTVITTISYISALLPIKLQILALYAIKDNEESSLPSIKSNKKRSRINRNPSLIKNLFISELTGIYVISTVLTIRSNLPYEVSRKLNELLGERFSVPNVVIDVWFYEVYACFCIIVFVATKVAEKTIFSQSTYNN
ncbi:hypothetical protein TPHA_0H01460 [Tetrapisispora phaffii CBS 4417]|uniref:Abscisic acid G-protein coupled receptor-like domain-containing protein n=1 Tax=Tetrapisispora phaffii (strain ATCC 24235 / CBS 4417 / NBRC 1672 / NRRL Y-8282 / UCD 70-5) TaxID=1071381 RepID=G8BX48_TETPH|nr:hypothetical protein TPHA_0H01460 [Tetrapisispora phaffii CBS 4417]CCE64352.1 hypothetical protein TPHA_0H01460 [Tetrapisispora phaffii CBS 4417]